MVEIREIAEDELDRFVAVRNAVWPQDPLTVEDLVDWRQQSEDMVWLFAAQSGAGVGAGVGIHGWHSPPGVGRLGVHVLHPARGQGIGSELFARLAAWLGEHGCVEATASSFEDDATSLAWATRRGFSEVGRNSIMALDLTVTAAPDVAPPAGVEIVTWAERPELVRGLYDVYAEAAPDIPGEDGVEIPPFDDWLANDMQGAGDRPEATFVAVAEGTVAGYAKLSISGAGGDIAWHDLTGVRRDWRGRGIAGALKRAQIAWAKANGYRRLHTMNEDRNEPIRRLNQRHGYRLEPGFVTVRGPIPDTEGDLEGRPYTPSHGVS
jgi:GNAT superfamily N-acetyltransferase